MRTRSYGTDHTYSKRWRGSDRSEDGCGWIKVEEFAIIQRDDPTIGADEDLVSASLVEARATPRGAPICTVEELVRRVRIDLILCVNMVIRRCPNGHLRRSGPGVHLLPGSARVTCRIERNAL